MAKGLLICLRDRSIPDVSKFIVEISERVRPDNAEANDPYVHQEEGLVSYIYNPTPTIRTQGAGFLLGVSDATSDESLEPRAERPDGSYAMFRANSGMVEILTDYTASRTIWYFFNDDWLIASNSQRLIVACLGDFQPNIKADSWMLSSGTLGPGEPWDRRLRCLPGNSRLVLERGTWNLIIEHAPSPVFRPESRSRQEHKALLKEAVKEAIESLDIGNSHWTLALSGGMDSRSILYHLQGSPGLNSVTWGLNESFEKPDSDASLARHLTGISNLPHEYARTDFRPDNLSVILDRFLSAGEGRVDHLSGYMDGLELWGRLSREKRGIIRGYDAFGRKPPVSNEYQARRASGLIVTEDFSSTITPPDYHLTKEDLPDNLKRQQDEPLVHWRDRLWLESRTPFVTAALEDIKAAYVEIVNPLLSRRVVEVVLTLPQDLRTNKSVFEEIVAEMFPGVPFAGRDSVQMVDDILSIDHSREFIVRELRHAKGRGILPDEFLDRLVLDLDKGARRHSFFRWLVVFIKASIPMVLENFLRSRIEEGPMNIRRIALRAIIITRMHDMLSEDAGMGRTNLTLATGKDSDRSN